MLAERAQSLALQKFLPWAIDMAGDAVVTAFVRHADSIIRDGLQPALAEIVQTVRQHAEAARRIPWASHTQAMRNESKEVREAFEAILAASERHAALREAHRLLTLGAPLGAFGEMKNLKEVWPGYAQLGHGTPPAPWHDKSPAQTLDLLVNRLGAELWAPTPGEAEGAFRDAREAAKAKSVRATVAL